MHDREIDQDVWLHHAWLNRFQSLFLLLVMATFFGLLGWLLWDIEGIVVLLLFGLMGVLLNTTISPQLIMSLYGARPVSPNQASALWRIMGQLSQGAGLSG